VMPFRIGLTIMVVPLIINYSGWEVEGNKESEVSVTTES